MALKVLLADDSMTAQNMGKKILADAGFQVIAVSNGAQAMKKFTAEKPDLVVLDVYMPGYSGLEVCERIKNAPETTHIPVVLCVGKMEAFRPEEGARVRADAVVVKPFEATELLSKVQALTERAVAARASRVPEPEPIEEPAVEAESEPVPAPRPSMEVPDEMAVAPAYGMDLVGEAEPAAPFSSSEPAAGSAATVVEFEIQHEREPVTEPPSAGLRSAEGLSGVFVMDGPAPAEVSASAVPEFAIQPAAAEQGQKEKEKEEADAESEVVARAEAAGAVDPDPRFVVSQQVFPAKPPQPVAETEPKTVAPESELSAPTTDVPGISRDNPAAGPAGPYQPEDSGSVAVMVVESSEPELAAWVGEEVAVDSGEGAISLEAEMRQVLGAGLAEDQVAEAPVPEKSPVSAEPAPEHAQPSAETAVEAPEDLVSAAEAQPLSTEDVAPQPGSETLLSAEPEIVAEAAAPIGGFGFGQLLPDHIAPAFNAPLEATSAFEVPTFAELQPAEQPEAAACVPAAPETTAAPELDAGVIEGATEIAAEPCGEASSQAFEAVTEEAAVPDVAGSAEPEVVAAPEATLEPLSPSAQLAKAMAATMAGSEAFSGGQASAAQVESTVDQVLERLKPELVSEILRQLQK